MNLAIKWTNIATGGWVEVYNTAQGEFVAYLYLDREDYDARRPCQRVKAKDRDKLYRWIERQFKELETALPPYAPLGRHLTQPIGRGQMARNDNICVHLTASFDVQPVEA